jgi:GAF domain-containing protein
VTDGEPVARALVALYDFVTDRESLDDALTRIVSVTTETLGADFGGITLRDPVDGVATIGSTDPLVDEVDEAQYRPGAGPCLTAMHSGEIVHTEDLRTDGRWPEFAQAATSRGILSTLSLPLIANERTDGAVNLYALRVDAFDDASVTFGRAFAEQAEIGIAYWKQAQLAEHLNRALESRSVIEQAKGVLMATTGCDADTAFDLLRQQSQAENRKLHVIAAELVARQSRSDR